MKRTRSWFIGFGFIGLTLICVIAFSGRSPLSDIPTINPISRIEIKLHSIPELGLIETPLEEIPPEKAFAVLQLVLPKTMMADRIEMESIRKEPHIGDVYLHHTNGTRSRIWVRWTGHNPAAVSFDDISYYWGGETPYKDGAMMLLRTMKNQTQTIIAPTEPP